MNEPRDTPDRGPEERDHADMPRSPQAPATEDADAIPGANNAPDPQVPPSVDLEHTADPSKD
jgi:hypothetical protein